MSISNLTHASRVPAPEIRPEMIQEYLLEALESKASDLHITVNLPPIIRVNGELQYIREYSLLPEHTMVLCQALLNDRQREIVEKVGEVDFSYIIPNVSRFRVNVYKQRKSYCAAIRVVSTEIPTLDSLGFPPILKEMTTKPRGLILVTGPTGSGKSTTLAAMVNNINTTRSAHILTLEEPIEYLHKHNYSMINQREVGDDSKSFANGLRAALREDPDVILVGEMRDLETISTAVSAAETGHLVMSTLHTTSAAQTIDRIIDVFPPYQQQQIRIQLSTVLTGIISQQLLQTADGKGRVAALEILVASDAVRNLVREGKTYQIPTILQTNLKSGMCTMDYSLAQLVHKGVITKHMAYTYCSDLENIKRYLNQNNQGATHTMHDMI
jgi:twitching motility protein PilT